MRRSVTTASIAVAALAVTAVAPLHAAASPGRSGAHELELTVLATTDLHGRVQDWDYFRNAPYSERSGDATGLARVASVVEAVRAEQGEDRVLVVDNGDFLQGTPLTYFYAKQQPVTGTGLEHPMAAAYDAIGYDAQVVGNHEYNYGLDLLQAYEDDAEHPVLGANVVDAATGEPYHQPYTLQRVQVPGHKPVTVGVLGLTTPGSAIWDKGNVEGRVEFLDIIETAQRWVPVVDAQADVVVVLSHAGTGGGSSYGPELPAENPSDVVARTVPGIDMMVVGHTHRDAPSQVVVNEVSGEEVLLTQPYRWGATVSRVDIALEKVRGQWDVVAKDATALRTRDYPEHPAVLAATQEYHETAVDYVNQVVATSTEELSAVTSRYEDTAILDFIQQVQTETVDAALDGTAYDDTPVLSIAAPFSREAVFPAGDVTIRDIAGLYIYDNTLEAVEMTGAQVRDYLEYSAKYFTQVPATGAVDPEAITNAGGTPDYNYDQLAGVEYDLDVSRPVGERVTRLVHPDGTPVADDDVFVVAVNNYRRSGGGNFPHVSTAPVVYNEQQEIRQLLIEWAQARGVIDPADFADESWWLVREGERLLP
ncbi:bifunctional metallophosphatase/5'-nucleotidase [Aquipuribacter nitratireducens]|uniref:Bifunctional metallophosphatase/5'-nucleotidase n=1 Tax=Aquipuribacter nitratireducens TaxID=650104 RepID=A0ABW0GI20_9MICO